jgi:hypothetical protein
MLNLQSAARRKLRLRRGSQAGAGEANVSEERDKYGRSIDPAERMQQVMLGLFDLLDEAREADFPTHLIGELDQLRLKFMDEFERRFPDFGKGRALWR